MLVKDKSGGLATSRESNLHLAFIDLVYITVGGDSEEIAFRVFSGAVERDSELEKFFEIGLHGVSHLI